MKNIDIYPYLYLSIYIHLYLYHTPGAPLTPFSLLLLGRMGRENRVEKLRDLLPVTFMQKNRLVLGKINVT